MTSQQGISWVARGKRIPLINHMGILVFMLLFSGGLADGAELIASPHALPKVVYQTMATYFEPQSSSASVEKQLEHTFSMPTRQKPAGVFVTLSDHGKPRACWGSLQPKRSNLLQETIAATLGALTKDYRYPPIRANEWKTLKPQVTIVRHVTPIRSFRELNPLQHGLMVRQGGKSGIILPGEVTDAYYQLVKARLKAGIEPNTQYQLYRIEADVYL